MPALLPTAFAADIVWLGRVTDTTSIRAAAVDRIDLTFAGISGDTHEGETRPSCSRLLDQFPRGTRIRNARQVSILSQEDLDAIAQEMGLEGLEPEWLGASMIVRGIPDFTHIPPSSRLQGPDGVMLVADMENRPCQYPAREIEKERPGFGKRFKPASKGRRGVTAWVEREGHLSVGDRLVLHVPDQPAWPHLDLARAT